MIKVLNFKSLDEFNNHNYDEYDSNLDLTYLIQIMDSDNSLVYFTMRHSDKAYYFDDKDEWFATLTLEEKEHVVWDL